MKAHQDFVFLQKEMPYYEVYICQVTPAQEIQY